MFFNILLSVHHFTSHSSVRVDDGHFRALCTCSVSEQTDGTQWFQLQLRTSWQFIRKEKHKQVPLSFIPLRWCFQHRRGRVNSDKSCLKWWCFFKDTKRGGGYVSQASIPSQQTAVPLWWRIWTEQRVHRRSPPLCCWGAYMAVLRPRWYRSRLGIWGQPYRRGPLWQRKNRKKSINIPSTPGIPIQGYFYSCRGVQQYNTTESMIWILKICPNIKSAVTPEKHVWRMHEN